MNSTIAKILNDINIILKKKAYTNNITNKPKSKNLCDKSNKIIPVIINKLPEMEDEDYILINHMINKLLVSLPNKIGVTTYTFEIIEDFDLTKNNCCAIYFVPISESIVSTNLHIGRYDSFYSKGIPIFITGLRYGINPDAFSKDNLPKDPIFVHNTSEFTDCAWTHNASIKIKEFIDKSYG